MLLVGILFVVSEITFDEDPIGEDVFVFTQFAGFNLLDIGEELVIFGFCTPFHHFYWEILCHI